MFRYDRMNALAQEKGIKKAHICRKLGKPVYYLRDVERNRSDIQGESLRIMADILGTTPEYLSGKTDEKEPPAPKNEDGFEKRAYALIQSASRLSAERQALLLVALEAVVQLSKARLKKMRQPYSVLLTLRRQLRQQFQQTCIIIHSGKFPFRFDAKAYITRSHIIAHHGTISLF